MITEHHRFGQRLQDFLDAGRDRQRRIEGVDEVDAGRQPRTQSGHDRLDAGRDVERVRSRCLEYGNADARLSVDTPDLLIVERAELDACDVLEVNDRPVLIRAEDDLLELLRGLQPSRRADRVSHVLAGRRRSRANLPGRIHGALLLHGAHDLGDGDAHRPETIGLKPDPQRVIAGAEHANLADAGDTV